MNNNYETFVIQLTDECENHEQWLAIVRFGLKTLLENQVFLMEIILREASREIMRSKMNSTSGAGPARTIFDELGLRFEITT